MTLYTNCEKFHCSMARPACTDDGKDIGILSIPHEIAVHLSITRKPKYPIISPLVTICEIDCCPMWDECNRNKKTKPAMRRDSLNLFEVAPRSQR